MSAENKHISRRDFLKILEAGVGALTLGPIMTSKGWERQKGQDGNLESGPSSELLPKEGKSGVITTKNMPVLLYPIQANWLYDYYANWLDKTSNPVREIKLTGVDLAYKDLFLSVKPDGTATRYTLFPYITGDKLIAIGTYDKGTYNSRSNSYTPTQTFYSEEVLDKSMGVPIGQCHTVISAFYPNKVWNDLQASIQIDKHQHDLGGFRAGIPVSYVDTILASVQDLGQTYKLGRAGPAAGLVPGGGVCATATNMCKLQTEVGSKITERQTHQVDVRYFYGPDKPVELTQKNADATVYYQDQNYREDLVWIPDKNQWIKISAALIPYREPIAGTARSGDAIMFLTYRAFSKNPGDQTINLKKLQDAYDAWRKDPTEINKKNLLNGCTLSQEIKWTPESETAALVRSISPEERVGRFSTELASFPILKDILQLQTVLSGYSYSNHYNKGIYLGDYLKNTDWYNSQIKRLNAQGDPAKDLDRTLHQLSHDCNLGNYQQPMQCVGLDLLMASLKYPGYPFFDFIDYDAANAKTLIPWSWRSIVGKAVEEYTFADWPKIDKVVAGLQPTEGSDRYGHKFTAFNAKSLEEINAGDIFVNMEGEAGHTGVIVGKKSINGETILLIADANGATDGQIHIREVDKCNFDIDFGGYPYPKTMIRKI